MHAGIDLREACRVRPTGKGRWTHGFVRELLTRGWRLSLFTDAPLPQDLADLAKRSGANVVILPDRGLRWHRTVSQMLQASGMELYISPTSYIVPFLSPSSVRLVPIVHDLIAFRPERHDRKARLVERLTLGRSVKRAWRVCTVSETTKHDLLARYPSLDPSRVVSIFAGGGEGSVSPSRPDQKTIVCIGTLCPRKNQLRLIHAFASLPSPLRGHARLVLVGGRGWDDGEVVRLARETEGVEWQGYLDEAALDVLLQSAAVFALPSLYEGFGLPLLDAMRYGIPILSADRGSLREVAGEASLYADPEDIMSLTDGLVRLLTDDTLRARLVAAGHTRANLFTWKRTVDLFLGAIAS